MAVLARTTDGGLEIVDRVTALDVHPESPGRSDCRAQGVESVSLFGPHARLEPSDGGVVADVDRIGVDPERPRHSRRSSDRGCRTTHLAFDDGSLGRTDPAARGEVVIQVRKQQRETSAASDVDSGRGVELALEKRPGKQEPVTASHLVGLSRSSGEKFGHVRPSIEHELDEEIIDLAGGSAVGEIRVVRGQRMTSVVEEQEVGARKEEYGNSLRGRCCRHQIEDAVVLGDSPSQAAVQGGSLDEGIGEVGEPSCQGMHVSSVGRGRPRMKPDFDTCSWENVGDDIDRTSRRSRRPGSDP